MAYLVLLTLGSALGWLAAILFKQDSVKQSFTNIAAGGIGALITYALGANRSEAASVSPDALILGTLGAALSVAIVVFLSRRAVR